MYDIYEFSDRSGWFLADLEAAAQLFESHQKLVRCVVPPEQLLETGCSTALVVAPQRVQGGDFYNGHMIGL